MVATLGEALDLNWRIRARCAFGKRDAMKSIRECDMLAELDLPTLVWTRGRAFPIGGVAQRLKCPRCGSLQVTVVFEPPVERARATSSS